jgi:hypothetical protein
MLSVHIKHTHTQTHTTHFVIYHGERNKRVVDKLCFESLYIDSEKKKNENNQHIQDKINNNRTKTTFYNSPSYINLYCNKQLFLFYNRKRTRSFLCLPFIWKYISNSNNVWPHVVSHWP